MGDYSREQKKPRLFGSAASVLHKCVYRKNIKSATESSLSFPRLINFSTGWQIFTWTRIGLERWMCKSAAGGKLNLSAQLLFHAFPILLVISVQHLSLSRIHEILSSQAWGATGLPVSPDSSTPQNSKQREWQPLAESRNKRQSRTGYFLYCVLFCFVFFKCAILFYF